MKKQSANGLDPEIDATIQHAVELVREYTAKVGVMARRLSRLRRDYLAANESRLLSADAFPTVPSTIREMQQRQLWSEKIEDYRATFETASKYVRAITPHARKLAQHLSQQITHGALETIVKIDLSLRVAELESVIAAVERQVSSELPYYHF